MYSSRIPFGNVNITEVEEEPEWVTFPCSPFSEHSMLVETSSNPKRNDVPASNVPRFSSYHQHMAAVEMIYGYPPDDEAPQREVPKRVSIDRESSPNSTIIHIPPIHQESRRQTSWIDQGESTHKTYPFECSPIMDSASVSLNTTVQHDKAAGRREHGRFPSLAVSLPQEDFEDELDTDSKKSFFCPFPWFCFLRIMCAAICIFLLMFFGMLIGTAIRGEPITLGNIFPIGRDQSTSMASTSNDSPTSLTLAPTSTNPIPSFSPTVGPTFDDRPASNITVGAYYYPWHGDDFHGRQGYLRRELNQGPLLGEYNDGDPKVIAQHLAWSRKGNIRLWITSWWGPNRVEDINTRDIILNHEDLDDHQIGLLYETTGRIEQNSNFSTSNVEDDIEYICRTYFDHPNYFRVDGRPVLFVYLTRLLDREGIMEEVILLMRSVADFWGHDLFIVGDHAFATVPTTEETFRPFLYLDAVTNYDVYGSMGATGYAGQDAVDAYFEDQHAWRQEARLHKCGFIPTVSPGYNDRGVRIEADHAPLSRKLTAQSVEGSLFEASLRQARYLVDKTVGDLLLVNSFNEWHEDSQIEPAIGTITNEPFDLTMGLEYSGYGELYLDLLRNATIEDFAAI